MRCWSRIITSWVIFLIFPPKSSSSDNHKEGAYGSSSVDERQCSQFLSELWHKALGFPTSYSEVMAREAVEVVTHRVVKKVRYTGVLKKKMDKKPRFLILALLMTVTTVTAIMSIDNDNTGWQPPLPLTTPNLGLTPDGTTAQ